MPQQVMGPVSARAFVATTSDKVESIPFFKGVQDNFKFRQALIRSLLMEKEADSALEFYKEQTVLDTE